MAQKDIFITLGAPLANPRWSWGSVRADGTVFLRVWQDGVRQHDDQTYVRLSFPLEPERQSRNLGYDERTRHVELIRGGAKCYLVMCQAVDVNAVPRQVKDFNETEVFPGGEVIDIDGDAWIKLGHRVPVRRVTPLS